MFKKKQKDAPDITNPVISKKQNLLEETIPIKEIRQIVKDYIIQTHILEDYLYEGDYCKFYARSNLIGSKLNELIKKIDEKYKYCQYKSIRTIDGKYCLKYTDKSKVHLLKMKINYRYNIEFHFVKGIIDGNSVIKMEVDDIIEVCKADTPLLPISI